MHEAPFNIARLCVRRDRLYNHAAAAPGSYYNVRSSPGPSPDGIGPADYACVTQSVAQGVVSIPSTAGTRSIAVSVDNTTGTDPVSLIGVTS